MVQDQIQQARKSPATRKEADCAMLMEVQATRPGGEADTKRLARLYGRKMTPDNIVVTPVQDKKGREKPPKVELQFGDEKVHIRDRGAADELIARKASGKGLEDSTYWLKSHGATTLEARHVVTESDGLHLKFMGKEGVWHDHLVTDKKTVAMLQQRAKTAGKRGGKLFDTSPDKVNGFISTLGGGWYSSKDLRTKRANEIALSEMKKFGKSKPKTERDRNQWIKSVAEAAARVLGNKPAQCIKSYINPTMWDIWPKKKKEK